MQYNTHHNSILVCINIYTLYTRLIQQVCQWNNSWQVAEEENNDDDENAGEKTVCTMIITIILYYIRENVPPRTGFELSATRLAQEASQWPTGYYSYIYGIIYIIVIIIYKYNIAADVSRGATFFSYSATISHKGI